ncbi:MAG: hypothetical protein IJG55_01675 [Synergistaceae bacterium]|nr:hypothetical protein [Synergistaceae bacterium]
MKKDKTYRFVEGCMYNYPANMTQMSELKERLKTLMSVRGHNYEAHIPNVTSDPVSNIAGNKIETERKIRELENYTRPVSKLHHALKYEYRTANQMLKLLELKYFRQEKPREVQEKMHISQATYWRRTQELMRLAKKYFGAD